MILDNRSEYQNLAKGSHKILHVRCDLQISDKCSGQIKKEYRTIIRDRNNNDGQDICFYCSRQLKNSGRNNSNCKYKELDDSFFTNINSEEKAYILGWIASDGTVTDGGFTIAINKRDVKILECIRDIICCDLKITNKKNSDLVSLSVSSKKISGDVCRHLNIVPGNKSHNVRFVSGLSNSLTWSFIRGLFDGDGSIRKINEKRRTPNCSIASCSKDMKEAIRNFCNIPCTISDDGITFGGNSALDFLGKIYNNAKIYMPRKRDLYEDICMWQPAIRGAANSGKNELFYWSKTREDAVAPRKERVSDSGFDLVVLEKIKQFGNVELWDTGIKICPAFGWYFDLVPRSSIIKTGYMLANSMGIIDRTYIGNIMAALVKIDPNAPDIKPGDRLVQIIPRQIVHVDLQIVEQDDLDQTSRGTGGFGSTGI